MNKSSIYLSQNNLAGEIILEKKSNNEIMVGHSNISNIIANRPNELKTLQNSYLLLKALIQ